jgi:hypothetical protein
MSAQPLEGRGLPVPAQVAIGVGGAALVAVDVALQLVERRGGSNGHPRSR